MHALVPTKVKLGNRLRAKDLCRFQHIVTREREDRPVMVRVRVEIEEGASYHLREARKQPEISTLADVDDALKHDGSLAEQRASRDQDRWPTCAAP
jgi:hypothetical protein